MRKVLVGLTAALIIGAGGYFGVAYWAERTATREVDAALDQWRSRVGPATRGAVAFDLWTRTVKVADVALASRASPDDKISIGRLVAAGVDAAGGARRLDLVDLELSGPLPGMSGARMQQKAPQVTFTGFSARPSALAKGSTAPDAMRIWLEEFSAVTADTIDVPTLTTAVTPPAGGAKPSAMGPAAYTYTNLMLRNVANGRVAEATVGGIALRSSTGPYEMTGDIGKLSIAEIDVAPVLGLLDPSRAGEDGHQRVYRRLSAGPYTARFGDGSGISIERIDAENVGLRRSKVSLEDLAFLAEVSNSGKVPTPMQAGMLVDKIAGLYEAVLLGKLEMRGLRLNMAQDVIRIAGIAVNGVENGRIGELTLEELDGQSPVRAPVNLGGMTLKGLHVANLLRTASAQLATPARPPPPEQILQLLEALEGVELRSFDVPDPQTGRKVHVDAFNAGWGQFVGGVPTKARIAARLSLPVDAAAPEPFKSLAARGIPTLTASMDIGAGWSEATQTLALEPATVEIGKLLALSLKGAVGNVQRAMFSPDPARAAALAALVETGPIEITLRDLGANELLAANLGQARGGGPEAGRAVIAETVAKQGEALSQANPELGPLFQVLGQFLQGSGETLTVTLRPKSRVSVLQLAEDARRDPAAVLLAAFSVEARTGK